MARVMTSLLGMSLVAWFVSVAVGRAAGEQGAGFALLTLDTFLAVLAVGGMELLVFALLPLQFLNGYVLVRQRPRTWAALWGFGVLWVSVAFFVVRSRRERERDLVA